MRRGGDDGGSATGADRVQSDRGAPRGAGCGRRRRRRRRQRRHLQPRRLLRLPGQHERTPARHEHLPAGARHRGLVPKFVSPTRTRRARRCSRRRAQVPHAGPRVEPPVLGAWGSSATRPRCLPCRNGLRRRRLSSEGVPPYAAATEMAVPAPHHDAAPHARRVPPPVERASGVAYLRRRSQSSTRRSPCPSMLKGGCRRRARPRERALDARDQGAPASSSGWSSTARWRSTSARMPSCACARWPSPTRAGSSTSWRRR